MRWMRGFTLLELLVVILLIGIITTFAVLATGDGGRERLVMQEAERFSALLMLAGDEAVLQSREYGVQFSDDGYRFMVFEPTGKAVWKSIEQDNLLRQRSVPAIIDLELHVDGLPVMIDARHGSPQLILSSSGERTPFELFMRSEQVLWRVSAGTYGKPQLQSGGSS